MAIATRVGDMTVNIALDNKNQSILATTDAGHSILLDDQNGTIVGVDKSGNNRVTIQTRANSMRLECDGDFTIEAQGRVSISGQQGVEIKTPMQVEVEGEAGVDIRSSSMLNLEGAASTSVTSSGMLTVQGPLVQIN